MEQPMNALIRCFLALPLAAAALAASAADTRLDAIWPEHHARLSDTQRRVDAINANPEISRSDADAKAVVEELLAEPHRPLTAAGLAGDWNVRSLQGGRYGIFPYPWFKARIELRDGRVFFEKLTGSQRRSGWLLPPADGKGDWYFTGGATVNEDPQIPYSKVGGGSARDSDSVGALWGIGEGRALMLLDVSDTDYEVYQLKR
jgi:hypothetical protein